VSEVAGKDEELAGLKVEMATLQEKLRSKIEEVDNCSAAPNAVVVVYWV